MIDCERLPVDAVEHSYVIEDLDGVYGTVAVGGISNRVKICEKCRLVSAFLPDEKLHLECNRCDGFLDISASDLKVHHQETNGSDLCDDCYDMIVTEGLDPEIN